MSNKKRSGRPKKMIVDEDEEENGTEMGSLNNNEKIDYTNN